MNSISYLFRFTSIYFNINITYKLKYYSYRELDYI